MNSHKLRYNINNNDSLTTRSVSAALVRNENSLQHSFDLAASDSQLRTSSSSFIIHANEPRERMHLNDNQYSENLSQKITNTTSFQPTTKQFAKSGFSVINNNSINSTSQQSLRSQSLTTKNFFDYNFQSQQHMLILTNTPPSKSNSTDAFNQLNTNTNNNNQSKSNHFQNHHFNSKMVNESNKFIENILTNPKRNFPKQSTSLSLLSPNQTTNQIVSLSANFTNHVNLPPTVLTICRTNEERFLFPDKLILERRNLNACPIIEGDDQLKLINYQHNQIRTIQNLDQMKSLIFLDLYDNRIERINGLTSLVNLRVLMLGKNRIEKIENLDSLVYLDVLDLHGNQITHIENLGSLHELRVLNIAANQIKVVENLNGLHSLVELNLRRNQVYEINDLENCSKLQRLFLSFNDIMSLMSIKNLSSISNLQELSLDNNPISVEKNYKRNVLAQLISLKKLDSKKVTDEEKRIAERMYLKSEFKKRELENYYFLEEKRKTIIRDAKTEWFALQNGELTRAKTQILEQKEPNVVSLNGNEIESKFILNDDLDFKSHPTLERMNSKQFNIISNSNITFQKPNQSKQAMLNYQNYLQQYQNQSQLSNSNKINAKLKIVTMRSLSQFPTQSSSMSQQNFNQMVSSSSSSSLHSNENESNKQIDSTTTTNNEYIVTADNTLIDQGDFQRAQAILISRSNSASSQMSKLATNTILTTTNQINSGNISVPNNIRRSITYNSGSNIHEDSIMYFYGVKSLEILDNKLESILTAQIMTISFHYIDYDDNLFKNFSRIKYKFPSVVNLIFTCCNIKNLYQIDNLVEWKRLESLTINRDDNPIYSVTIWPHYTICRLATLQLKKLNDKLISADDVTIANKFLNTYLNWALYLPEYKLGTILGQEKKKLIKIAKEKLNDPDSVPTQEQISARETIIKAVSASNNQQFRSLNCSNNINNNNNQTNYTVFNIISSSTNTNNNINTITSNDCKQLQNQTFVNNIFSQMSYNDYKKQKIKSLQNDIWNKVIDYKLKDLNKKDKHVKTICEKKKLHI